MATTRMREHVCWMVERKVSKQRSPDSEFCKVWLTAHDGLGSRVFGDVGFFYWIAFIVVRKMAKPLCNMKQHEPMRWCLSTWVQKIAQGHSHNVLQGWRQRITFFLESRLLFSRTCRGNCLVHISRFLLCHPFLCIFSRISALDVGEHESPKWLKQMGFVFCIVLPALTPKDKSF